MRKSSLAVASLALAGAAFLLARDERAAPEAAVVGGDPAQSDDAGTTRSDGAAAVAPWAGPEAAPPGARAEAPAVPPPVPVPPGRPPLAIAGRSHAEIQAALRERSRERAIAAGKLAEWEEREARRAASRERRRGELEASRARAGARAAQAREEARRIAAGEPTRPQLARDGAVPGLYGGGEEQRVAGDAPSEQGGR
jgi:hypothetical protein